MNKKSLKIKFFEKVFLSHFQNKISIIANQIWKILVLLIHLLKEYKKIEDFLSKDKSYLNQKFKLKKLIF